VVTALTNAQTRSTSLLADDSAAENARLFARAQLPDWGLGHLEAAACTGLGELLGWLRANDPNVLVEITLVWDPPLLFTEVADRHETLPRRPVWLLAAGGREQVARLEAASLEWGAELDARGRRLWASYSAENGSGDAGSGEG